MHRLLLAILLLALATPAVAQVQRQNDNLSIFFTSDVQGEVTSCGCPTLDLGGATHRAAFLDTLRSSGWEFLVVDAGGIAPFGPMNAQKMLKVEHLARSMARMGFDGIALGDHDLALGPEFVGDLLAWLDQPVVATNVTLPEGYPTVPSRIVQVREPTVGLVAFLDPSLVTEDHAWITVTPWEDHRDAVATLKDEVDVLVALAAVADSTRLLDLAAAFPEVDLVIGSHRGDLPVELVEVGDTRVIGGGTQGKYLGRVEVTFDETGARTDLQSNFLQVIERWGRRPWIDDLVTQYHRKVRELMMEAAGEGSEPGR